MKLYQRSGLTFGDFCRVMHRGEWMSLAQIAGALGVCIAPEAAVRFFRLNASHFCKSRDTAKARNTPLSEQISRGKVIVVRRRLSDHVWKSRIESKASNNGCGQLYRLVKDTDGKSHAKQKPKA